MTPNDRPRQLARGQLNAGLVDLAGTSTPDYRDDILGQVARTRQRPAWTFIERWLPMSLITVRPATAPPMRAAWVLLIVGLLTAALVASLVLVGSQLLKSDPKDGLKGLLAIPALELDTTWDSSVVSDLSMPAGTDVGPDGNLYVVNGGTSEILVLDQAGSVVRRWGSKGSGDGQFIFQRDPDDPASSFGGVAVAADGSVYVADPANRRVQQFDATGAFVQQWGDYGPADGQFLDPLDITVGPDGSVYVADDQRDDIQRFSASGTHIATVGSHGTGDGQLNNTGGVATDVQGNVYNADYANNRVQAWDPDGSFLWSSGVAGTGPGAFDLPNDITADASGNLFVADSHRVQVLGPAGDFLHAWAGPRATDQDLLTAISVAPDGSVYVSATSRDLIYKLNVVEQARTAEDEPIALASTVPALTAVGGSSAPSVVAATDSTARTPFVIDQIFPVGITFDMPGAWNLNALSRGRAEVWDPTKGSAFVVVWVVSNAYPGGCATEPLSPPVGPSVQELTDALTHLEGYRVGPVSDVTIDGFGGKAFDLDFDGCPSGESNQWTFDASSTGAVREESQFSANAHQRIAIIDVDGTRLLVEAWTFPMARRDEVLEANQVFDSIRFSSLPESDCRIPNTQCLGDLAAGTHGSKVFEPRGSSQAARSAHRTDAVTYETPEGWANVVDGPAEYSLVPQAAFAKYDPQGLPPDRIRLLARPAATLLDEPCDFAQEPGVGRSVEALVEWITNHKGVLASAPESITIDGHPAVMLDAQVDPAWTGTCSWFDWGPLPFVSVVTEADIGPAGFAHALGAGPQRLIFLDLDNEDVVMIALMSEKPEGFDALVEQAMPIVKSLKFAG